MTPGEEHQLYMRDRAAWARYVAPRVVEKMRVSDAEKRRLWGAAGPELRAEIRRIAEAEK